MDNRLQINYNIFMSTFDLKIISPKKDFKKFRDEVQNRPKKSGFLKRVILLVFIATAGWVLFTYILPNVKVTVVLSAEKIEKEFDIILQKDAAPTQGETIIFPGEIKTLSGQEEDTFEATGKKDVGEKAKGQVIFYNYTGRASPLTTKIELTHDSGKKYFLTQNLTVPQATVSDFGEIVPGITTAEVEAVQAGNDYNQGAGRLNISVFAPEVQNKIYGETQEIINGTSDIIKVVSQEDLDLAQEELVSRLTPTLKDELKKQLSKTGLVVRDELVDLKIINIEKNSDLNSEVEKFNMKLQGEVQALVFKEEELKKFLKSIAQFDLPDNKMITQDDLGELLVEVKNFSLEHEKAELLVKVKYNVYPQVDLNSFKQEIKGLSESSARRILLQKDNVRDVRFDFSLSLNSKVPSNLNKIDIKVGD